MVSTETLSMESIFIEPVPEFRRPRNCLAIVGLLLSLGPFFTFALSLIMGGFTPGAGGNWPAFQLFVILLGMVGPVLGLPVSLLALRKPPRLFAWCGVAIAMFWVSYLVIVNV
jgi:hypothetical protein